MDFQLIGLIAAVIGLVSTLVWLFYLRRGVKSLEKASSALEAMARQEQAGGASHQQ